MQIKINDTIYKKGLRKNQVFTELFDFIQEKISEGFFPFETSILNQTQQRVSVANLRFYLERNNYCLVDKEAIWLEKIGEESKKIEVLA